MTENTPTTTEEYKLQPTVSEVNEAVAKAGGITQPTLTAKQQEKQDKKEKEYWNGMMTRREVAQLIQDFAQDTERKMQTLFIQNATLVQLLEDKGMITAEELDATSKVIIEELFGPAPEPEVHTVAEAPIEESVTDEQATN